MRKTEPKIDHLERATKIWFQQIVKDFELESHHLRVLLTAAEMWDRAASARESIKEHGVMVKDRYGTLRANPACELERSSKVLFLKSLRELGLDVEAVETPRPPVAPGNANRRKA